MHAGNNLHTLDPFPDNPKPILLLHGLGSESSSWAFQIAALGQAGYRPIGVDLPGFGKSEPLRMRWTIEKAAKLIVTHLNNQSIFQADVMGISLGGALAIQIGLMNPGFTNHLILINTFAYLRPQSWNERIYLVRRFLVSMLKGVNYQAEMVSWRIFPAAQQAEYRKMLVQQILDADSANYRWAMVELAMFDKRKEITKLTKPTLVISGENDTTVSLKIQNELADGIPGAKHVVIHNAGHALIVDQPDEVNRELLQFLSA
jgi:pimeloyl-ACP methyl ester carboxylesterase